MPAIPYQKPMDVGSQYRNVGRGIREGLNIVGQTAGKVIMAQDEYSKFLESKNFKETTLKALQDEWGIDTSTSNL